MSDLARVTALLTARFHQRQVMLIRQSVILARQMRTLVSRLTKEAVAAAFQTPVMSLRTLHDRLDLLLARARVEFQDAWVDFAQHSFVSAVRTLLKSLSRQWLVILMRRVSTREAEEPIGVQGRWDWETMSREKLEQTIQSLLFDPPSREDVLNWLRTSLPGGLSWDERLKSWIEQTRAVFLTQITQGLVAGETPDEIERRLRPFADGLAYKSERIARTEACRVAERANLAMCDRIGDLIAGQQIFAVLDEWTRPHHAARHGRVYWKQPDGTYRDDEGNLLPELPDEPNCRCMTVPVLKINELVGERPTVVAQVSRVMGASAPQMPHIGYEDWWKSASERERMTAVGVKRYQTAKEILGRAPEWIELVDRQGRLLPVETLERETAEERHRRVEEIRSQVLQQELAHLGLFRTGGLLPAKLPGANNQQEALRTIEQRIRGQPLEYAFSVAEDGTVMFAQAGDVGRVRFSERVAARFVGTTLTHNHPQNSMLSGQDVRTLIRASLRSVRAVTEREVFEIRQTATRRTLKPNRELADKVSNDYEGTFRTLVRPYTVQYGERRMAGEPRDSLNRWWQHVRQQVRIEAIEDIASRYNLIFRRETL